MKLRHVEAFGDSLLVVQQVSGECQCSEGSFNAYLDKCQVSANASMNFAHIIYIGMRIVELMIWCMGHLVIMYKVRISMLKQNRWSGAREFCFVQSLTV
jgi:hypothetical protein